METPPEAPRRGAGLPGPLLLLLPITALAAALAWMTSRRPVGGVFPAAPSAGEAVEVDAWSGAGDAGDGRLVASLTRLFADPTRQAFDARALSERLALGAGEAWRLELRYDAPEGAAPLVLPTDLGVRGSGEPALRVLERPVLRGGPVDPVAVLVAPPEALAPGREADLVLWGEEPRGEARLLGAGIDLRLGRSFRARRPGASLLADGGPDDAAEETR